MEKGNFFAKKRERKKIMKKEGIITLIARVYSYNYRRLCNANLYCNKQLRGKVERKIKGAKKKEY